MDYIVIPTTSKSEKNFFLDMLKKMQKKATTLSTEEMEDFAFMIAMKEAEQSGIGSLPNVKAHLSKVAGK
jgi:hypothetical protein